MFLPATSELIAETKATLSVLKMYGVAIFAVLLSMSFEFRSMELLTTAFSFLLMFLSRLPLFQNDLHVRRYQKIASDAFSHKHVRFQTLHCFLDQRMRHGEIHADSPFVVEGGSLLP